MNVFDGILIQDGVAYPENPQVHQKQVERQAIDILRDQLRDATVRLHEPTRQTVDALVRYQITSVQNACTMALTHMENSALYNAMAEHVKEAFSIKKDINKFKRKQGEVDEKKGYEAPQGNQNWRNKQTTKKQKTSNQTPAHEHASGSSTQKKCFNCGGEGHTRQECTSIRNAHIKCFNCGNMGHYSNTCAKPRGLHVICFNCEGMGHFSSDCTKPRQIVG